MIDLSRRMGADFQVRAIRLDSGDLADLAKRARTMLDEAGLGAVRIFASGGLDEFKINDLVRQRAPIDGFGVGSSLAVSDDAPVLDMAYKLVEYAGRARTKLSAKKALYPGRKQFFRETASGKMIRDTLARGDERLPGKPQLIPVMRDGQRVRENGAILSEAREHALRELDRLPDQHHRLDQDGDAYPVAVSDALQRDWESMRDSLGKIARG